VALSQVVVGAGYPLMILLTLSRAKEHRLR
jgi:hypothetical protein